MTAAIARILDRTSKAPTGGGVHVGSRLVFTAAHVVNVSLGLDPEAKRKPQDEVWLDFPFVATTNSCTAHVVNWKPLGEGDVATLALDEEAPLGVAKAILGEDPWVGATVSGHGFPPTEPNGVLAQGVIEGELVGGYLQLTDNRLAGYVAEEGFSGAPVWMHGRVAGILVQANPKRRTSAIVPASKLQGWFPAQDASRGTALWRLRFFRSNGMTALLNDLQGLETEGAGPELCPVIKEALGRIGAEFSDFEALANWDSPLHRQVEQLRDLYDRWNGYPDGDPGARGRAQMHVEIVQQRHVLSQIIRQAERMLVYEPELDQAADRMIRYLQDMSNARRDKFPEIRSMVREYRRRARDPEVRE